MPITFFESSSRHKSPWTDKSARSCVGSLTMVKPAGPAHFLSLLLLASALARLDCRHYVHTHGTRWQGSAVAPAHSWHCGNDVPAGRVAVGAKFPGVVRHGGALHVHLRGGGKPKVRLGGKPLPGRGYMGRVFPRSPRDPLAQSEREMIARASKHRRASTKVP